MTSKYKIPKRFDGPVKFTVEIVVDNTYMDTGLCFDVISETKHLYHGIESGMGGTYFVTVPKKYCKLYDRTAFTEMIAAAVKHSRERREWSNELVELQ